MKFTFIIFFNFFNFYFSIFSIFFCNYYNIGKLFYVLTALVDNNIDIQMKFREFNGFSILGEILSKKPSYFDFPSEFSSSQDIPTSTTDDIDEDDIPKGN